MDERKAERVRESVRTGLAKALAATAQGLATVSRAAASTASQLRPPEPAEPSRPAPGPPRTPPATAPESSAESAVTETAPDAAVTTDHAPTESSSTRSADDGSADSGRDVSALAERNARDVIAEISDLGPADLRRLRTAEQRGKARKTVLAAIDRALEA